MALDIQHFYEHGKKIVGAGINFKSLIAEKKYNTPKEPLMFLKPTTSYTVGGHDVKISPGYRIDYEVELGVIIGKNCKNVSVQDVDQYIAGYCLAQDLTDNRIIKAAIGKGRPWDIGKGFDMALPVSEGFSKDKIPDRNNVRLWCYINGEKRQDNTTADMLFSVDELISFFSTKMTLEPYDIVITGSPAGVGTLTPGDVVRCGVGDNVATLEFKVVDSN